MNDHPRYTLEQALLKERRDLMGEDAYVQCPLCEKYVAIGSFLCHMRDHGLKCLEASFRHRCLCGQCWAPSMDPTHAGIWLHWREMGAQHVVELAVEAALRRGE